MPACADAKTPPRLRSALHSSWRNASLSALGIGLTPVNLILFQPYLSVNVGGVYGAGVQDGFIAGPELGFQVNMTERVALRTKVAYDYQFRNSGDFHKGIAWAGLGLGYRF